MSVQYYSDWVLRFPSATIKSSSVDTISCQLIQDPVMSSCTHAFTICPLVRSNTSDSGNLLAFFRDRKGKWIYTSTSTDDGRTWPKEPTQTKLPNNNSGIQVIVLANGKLVLVFNNLQVRLQTCQVVIDALFISIRRFWQFSIPANTGNPKRLGTMRTDGCQSQPGL